MLNMHPSRVKRSSQSWHSFSVFDVWQREEAYCPSIRLCRRFWMRRIVRLATRFLRADMVGKFIATEVAREAIINLRQHSRVPFVPLRYDSIINILVAHLQVGAFHRVLNDIEEKRVV